MRLRKERTSGEDFDFVWNGSRVIGCREVNYTSSEASTPE
jgi:hypothetical protein